MLKGAIFDLDGTLIDSMFVWDTIAEDYLRCLRSKRQKQMDLSQVMFMTNTKKTKKS